MFVNPPFQIRRYLTDGRGNDAHMFTFGRAIYDPHGIVAQLQDEARAIWQAGPPPFSDRDMWMQRYFAADALRDLADLGEDRAATDLLVLWIVEQLIEAHYRLNGRWIAKLKRRLTDLDCWAPQVARLARAALADGSVAERRAALLRMAEPVLAPIGGLMPLEWRTAWEDLPEM